MFSKKPKTVDFFVVTSNVSNTGEKFDLDKTTFFTITETKSQSEEYVNRRLYLEYKEHFISWCGLREIDANEKSSWEKYIYSTENISFNKYSISKITYKLNDIAMIFRMFNSCVPIGTSYEHQLEVIQFMQSLPKESLERIEKNIKESDDNKIVN
jgi:hypothetical protein